MRIVGPVLSLTLALPLFAPVSAEADESFDRSALQAFLDILENEYAKMTAVSYRFEQIHRLPELTGEVELTGSVLHQRPSEVRLEVRGQENFDLLADGVTVWLVDRDFGDVESFPISELDAAPRSRLLPPLLLDDPAQWRLELEVVEFEKEGSTRRLVFESASDVTSRFESLTLVFKGRRLKESIARYGERDEAITRYSDWQRLGALSHSLFRYQINR